MESYQLFFPSGSLVDLEVLSRLTYSCHSNFKRSHRVAINIGLIEASKIPIRAAFFTVDPLQPWQAAKVFVLFVLRVVPRIQIPRGIRALGQGGLIHSLATYRIVLVGFVVCVRRAACVETMPRRAS